MQYLTTNKNTRSNDVTLADQRGVIGDLFAGEQTLAERGSQSDDTIKRIVNKSNRLIGGQSMLTLNQQKLLSAAISLINPTDPRRDAEGYVYIEMDYDYIAVLLDTQKRLVKRFIKEAVRAFHSIPIEIPSPDEGADPDIINIAHKSSPMTKNGTFKIQFHKDIEEELLVRLKYARYELKHVVKISSVYSFRLYEIMAKCYNYSKPGPQFRKMRLQDLYFPLGLTDIKGVSTHPSYTRKFAEFRNRILEPACREVSEKTDLVVTFTTYRSSRKIDGINFVIRTKTAKLKADSLSLPMAERLNLIGLSASAITKILKSQDEETVSASLDYLHNLIESGKSIDNQAAFFQYLIKNKVARLPDVARPYSEPYGKNHTLNEFVNRYVVANWWDMSAPLQDHILGAGGVHCSEVTKNDVAHFVKEVEKGSIIQTITPQDMLDAWEMDIQRRQAN